jgi:hypothetical protein
VAEFMENHGLFEVPPSVYPAEIRAGKPEVILDKVLERYG